MEGLSDAELRHFGSHGWVLKAVFSPDECAKLRAAGDDELEARAAAQGTDAATLLHGGDSLHGNELGSTTHSFHGTVIIDTVPSEEKPEGPATAASAHVFKAVWEAHPQIQASLAQLLGSSPAFSDSSVRLTTPHPCRHDPTVRSKSRQPSGMSWHRGIRPRWGVKKARSEGQLHSSWVNTATFLTDVSHSDDGATFVLSGSHLVDLESRDTDVYGLREGEHPAPQETAGEVSWRVPSSA
jgi:hypothetical protein